MTEITIIGGGLAGSEAAWQAAERGANVNLYEMRPQISTGAHQTEHLAELICSNSLGSLRPDRANGLLKEELTRLGSLLVKIAEETAIPAGSALAVDRAAFAQKVTRAIEAHPRIHLIRQEVTEIPEGLCVVAAGPLASPAFTRTLQRWTGEESLFFYDAIAPVVAANTIDMAVAFRASRYDHGETQQGDYINCPFNKDQYHAFREALITAERIHLHDFETEINQGVAIHQKVFFERCLPVEILAAREERALIFGPMRPVGIRDPRTGRGAYAIVQLRQDNLSASMYNLVGFQTNLTYAEQKRVFRMIPGLEQAEFLRYGQMHRNTYLCAPRIILPTLQTQQRADLFFAGQIIGLEGYLGNIASGLVAGWNAARLARGQHPLRFPPETMLGSLLHYISHASPQDFQPMKANYGLLIDLTTVSSSRADRNRYLFNRSMNSLEPYIQERLSGG